MAEHDKPGRAPSPEDELHCVRLELETVAGLLLRSHLERWVPGFVTPRLESEHGGRYRWAAGRVAGKRVLDAACGAGRGSAILGEAGAASVTGVDIDDRVVRYAQVRHPTSNVRFECADLAQYTPAEKFDVVVSFETIEHMPDAAAYLDVMAACLAPGGEYIVSTPISDVAHDTRPANPFHVQEWGLDAFASLLARRFSVVETYLQLTKEPRNYARRIQQALGAGRGGFVPDEVVPAAQVEPLARPGVRYRGYQVLVCRSR